MKKQRRNLTQDPLISRLMRDPRCANFGYRPNKGIRQDNIKPSTSVKRKKESGGRGRRRESGGERIENRKFVSRANEGDAVADG